MILRRSGAFSHSKHVLGARHRKTTLTISALIQASNQQSAGALYPLAGDNACESRHRYTRGNREREREKDDLSLYIYIHIYRLHNAAARSLDLFRFFLSVSGENSILEGCIGNVIVEREPRRFLRSSLFTRATAMRDERGVVSRAGGYPQNYPNYLELLEEREKERKNYSPISHNRKCRASIGQSVRFARFAHFCFLQTRDAVGVFHLYYQIASDSMWR